MLSDDEKLLAKAGWRSLSHARQLFDIGLLLAGIASFIGGLYLLVVLQNGWGLFVMMLMCFFFPAYFGARDGLVWRARHLQCCFGCGYSLIGVPRDEVGDGTCPECGAPFSERNYRQPERE